MQLKARYCAHCGAALEAKVVDEKLREVCPACETVFYRNPLPVASALVLNAAREVLLVKRRQEPHRGMWCLPIGFAELDETISEAALRELREEASIEARVVRLLDVDSHKSDFYGEMLIVTFEAEKMGGVEKPGDDADAAAYFALDRLPQLAFRANQRAIEVCKEVHKETWAIQDSFEKLQADEPEEMLSDALVTTIRDRSEEIARTWLADVQTNLTTPSYRNADADELLQRASTALAQFGRWLRGAEPPQEIWAFYRALGAERRASGVPLHEVLSSLSLFRKHVWTFARGQGVWQRPIDVYRVLELDRRVMLFFDRAMYRTAKGFASGQGR